MITNESTGEAAAQIAAVLSTRASISESAATAIAIDLLALPYLASNAVHVTNNYYSFASPKAATEEGEANWRRFAAAVEDSSIGTPTARALRRTITDEMAEEVLRASRER